MDLQFGRIMEALESVGQLENTLIVFLSDNGGVTHIGGSFNGPLRGGKGTFYEGGVRVPAFAYWSGRIKPGQVSEALSMRLIFSRHLPVLLKPAFHRSHWMDLIYLLFFLQA